MTRIQQAQTGSITDEMRAVAQQERLDAALVRERVAAGTISIVKNQRRSIQPLALGAGTRVKINANIGTSSSRALAGEEIAKMKIAVEHGADAIMDLSTHGDLPAIRAALLEQCPRVIGTVPLYEAALNAARAGRSVFDLTADEIFAVIKQHCAQGVDFLTLHCGVTRHAVVRFCESGRLTGAVSRGGTIMMEWISRNGRENPLYEYYDHLLDILAEYDVAASLGDGFRPGCLHDATDRAQIEELVILGELVKRARARGVTVFVEGPGHVPLNQIAANMQVQKTLCDNAPFYVLGPLVTDVAPGYDHIAAAIGGAVAAMAGADFLCYVTPAEHLRLPSIDDVKDGVIALRIAAHAADIARGHPHAREWDDAISRAKMELDWDRIISLCIDPQKARAYRQSLPPNEETLCSMCGEFCAIKRSKAVGQTQAPAA